MKSDKNCIFIHFGLRPFFEFLSHLTFNFSFSLLMYDIKFIYNLLESFIRF